MFCRLNRSHQGFIGRSDRKYRGEATHLPSCLFVIGRWEVPASKRFSPIPALVIELRKLSPNPRTDVKCSSKIRSSLSGRACYAERVNPTEIKDRRSFQKNRPKLIKNCTLNKYAMCGKLAVILCAAFVRQNFPNTLYETALQRITPLPHFRSMTRVALFPES
jgi:hypothetical protein